MTVNSDDAPDRVAALLTRTAEAHHQAFISTDGFDPNWPAWYARYLLENGFDQLIGNPNLSVTGLTNRLIEADRKHQTAAPETPWELYYAKLLVGRLGA